MSKSEKESQLNHVNEITLLEKNLFSAIMYNKGELDFEEEKFLIQFFRSPFKELLTKIHESRRSEDVDKISLFFWINGRRKKFG